MSGQVAGLATAVASDRRGDAAVDDGAANADFRRALVQGLGQQPKRIPPKYLYDALGSALFDAITHLPEYYPTRTELSITAANAPEIAARCGPRALLIELGSGSSVKTRMLLDALPDPAGYVPVDISGAHLQATANRLATDYPDVPVLPVAADYTERFEVPNPPSPVARRVVYYPGSTIGNFRPAAAAAFLGRVAALCGPTGVLVIGVDRLKAREVVLPAYDDALGVTSAFARNLLVRANREIGADFDPRAFEHEAIWRTEADDGAPDPDDLAPPGRGRIEMWLRSRRPQRVSLGDAVFAFDAGEGILIEYSYKYAPEAFAALAAEAGFKARRSWTDERQWFDLSLLTTTA